MRSINRSAALALLAVLALLTAACGDDKGEVASSGGPAAAGDATDDATDAAFPVTVTVAGIDTTIEAEPVAIVSLSPTGTEMLFAVGAGDQVIAADDYSDYPAEAPTTDLSAYEPNVEAIVSYGPDLVVLSGDRNDVAASLTDVGVPVLILPSAQTLDDTYDQIEVLGAATGHVGDAAEVVSTMQTEIDELVAQVPERDAPLTYFHELDDTLFSVTSQTFIGAVYSLAGLENVADAADPDGENGGYPQVSAEFLVDADPDLFFLADTKCCGQTAETVAARGGFEGLRAVQEGNVIELDDDIASRWGPRIVDFLRTIVEATAEVEAPANAG